MNNQNIIDSINLTEKEKSNKVLMEYLKNGTCADITKFSALSKLRKNEEKYGYNFLLTNMDIQKLKNYMIDLAPRTYPSAYQSKSILKSYVKFALDNGYCKQVHYELYEAIQSDEIWLASEDIYFKGKSYFNADEYPALLNEIDSTSLNLEQDKALFMLLYEGVFFGSYEPFNYIRANNIKENTLITKLPDEITYSFTISNKLRDTLISASQRFTKTVIKNESEFERRIDGVYPDSCFKFGLSRADKVFASNSSYTRRFNNILEDIGLNMTALDLYTIGLIHRVDSYLKNTYGYDIESVVDNLNDLTIKSVFGSALIEFSSPAYKLSTPIVQVMKVKKMLSLKNKTKE